jgi:hypothetical protein
MPAFDPPDVPAPSGPLARHVLDVIRRHPGAALPADRLHELVGLESPDIPPGPDELLRSLSDRETLLHVLVPRRRRWSSLAPRPWVLAKMPGSGAAGHPLLEGLRETLRRLGQGVDPDSNLQMARWERYIMEEAEVHRAVSRQLRRLAPGRRRSTIRPRDLPR